MAIEAAAGRLLTSPFAAPRQLPMFDTARMDGYAVAAGETEEQLPIRGTVAAGSTIPYTIQTGECLRIMTGAPVPEGTEKVIPRELVHEGKTHIRIAEQSEAAHITAAGSYVRKGDPLLQPGFLGAAHIGTLAWAGADVVETAVPVPTAVISTGNELRRPGTTLQRGEIYDALGPLLSVRAPEAGMQVVRRTIVEDSPERLREEIAQSLDEARLLLLSGGVSRGDYDYTAEALEACGVEELFHRVAIKPGRPLYFGVRREPHGPDRYVFGLPGNPVSAFLDFVLFAERLIRGSAGLQPSPAGMRGRLAERVSPSDPQRGEFFPVRFTEGRVAPIGYRDSGNISGFAAAEGLLFLPPGAKPLEAEEDVYVRPL